MAVALHVLAGHRAIENVEAESPRHLPVLRRRSSTSFSYWCSCRTSITS
jgi:hypothetical protein